MVKQSQRNEKTEPVKGVFKEFTWEDGGKYEGEWVDGKMHGQGTYKEPDGSRYEGEWVEGQMCGKGVQLFAKGDRYTGEFKDSLRHGKGKQSFYNGNSYDGDFYKGKIHGYGTYLCADGREYIGEFANDKKHGEGKYKGANGSYVGSYRDGKKHGRASLSTPALKGRLRRCAGGGSVVYDKGRTLNALGGSGASAAEGGVNEDERGAPLPLQDTPWYEEGAIGDLKRR